jgi:hypothetical protein
VWKGCAQPHDEACGEGARKEVHKKGTYIIERRAVEEVLTALGSGYDEAAKKIKTTAAVFELPQKLGVLQYVEYEPPPREWCVNGCLYEGLLRLRGAAEGCA